MFCEIVGVNGFEPSASSSRTTRANRAALHPAVIETAKVVFYVKPTNPGI